MRHDAAPSVHPEQLNTDDAEPKFEPYAPANLKPYTVLGKNYTPLNSAKGYTETGTASWYGQKFHGHLTSNGEIYDMYAMTAAHKTLPLPSFVKVTNLDNNKTAIVRVNDRGPFHGGRIIDLSYAAARKLGVLATGTAPVKLESVYVDEEGLVSIGNQPARQPEMAQITNTISPAPSVLATLPAAQKAADALYIQVIASQNGEKIQQLADGLAALYQVPTSVPNDNGVYRLRLGPIKDELDASVLLQELQNNGYENAYKVYLSQ